MLYIPFEGKERPAKIKFMPANLHVVQHWANISAKTKLQYLQNTFSLLIRGQDSSDTWKKEKTRKSRDTASLKKENYKLHYNKILTSPSLSNILLCNKLFSARQLKKKKKILLTNEANQSNLLQRDIERRKNPFFSCVYVDTRTGNITIVTLSQAALLGGPR